MPAADALVSQAALEDRVGARVLARLLDDDNDGVADPALVEWVIETASAEAYGLLRNGFESDDKIRDVVDTDAALRNAIVELAIGLAGSRKPSMVAADGSTPYAAWRAAATKSLREWGMGKRRAKGETEGGRNAATRVRVQPIPAGDTVFIPDGSNPKGPGGF